MANEPAAAVITKNRNVYLDVSVTLRRMGTWPIYHVTPQQMLQGPPHLFWVLDGQLPGAVLLADQLLRQGRHAGLYLSTRLEARTHRQLVQMGVPAMLLHRAIQLPEQTAGAETLTLREVQIVELLAQGSSNQQVGRALGIQPLTVKSHLARISRKLDAEDRAHIVAICMRAGVIR